ncbi:hypothetical protein Tco_1456681 [Tanacetum coccineum]
MGVIMELHEGESCRLATREVVEEGEGDDEEGDGEGETKEVGGSADIYRDISQERGDGVTIYTRRRHHDTCDGVRILLTTSNAQVIIDEKKLESS